MHCTFCIVPRTRGPERSRTIAEIVSEIRGLVGVGVKEVTLLGQIVNLYGRHEFSPVASGCNNSRSKSPFVQLLEAANAVDGLERLRFTSPHPIGFRDDLIEAIGTLPKLAEHVHLPLQSGSNPILKAMHRAYTAEKYVQLVHKIRAARPGIAITTDIIVGFPGEMEADYEATRALVQELEFDNAFVFRYSARAETPASDMPDQVEDSIKQARHHDLLEVVNALTRQSNQRLVGIRVEALCEGTSKTNPQRLIGRTRTNKVVVFDAAEDRTGEMLQVEIERANGFSLLGRIVD